MCLTVTPVGLSLQQGRHHAQGRASRQSTTPDATPWSVARTYPKQSRECYWVPLPGLASVALMDLRNSTCRWPVDDPRHKDVVRFCGSVCGSEASYCDIHKKMGTTPSRGSVLRPAFIVMPAVSKVAEAP